MTVVGASGGGEERNNTKTVMKGVGGTTRPVGEDWADRGNMAKNQGSGDVDKGCRDSGSLILGRQNPCLHERTKFAPTIHKEHMQISDASVRLSNIRKSSTWTRLVRMDIGPMGC